METILLPPASLTPVDHTLHLAVAPYLARYQGLSRIHAATDLRSYLTWCADHGLDPFQTQRPLIELFVRWMQEVRHHKPSVVSRRQSVIVGIYRTCVIDGRPAPLPAEYVRRPHVPSESPTLGLTHLFEAMLAAGRDSTNHNDVALCVPRAG